MLNFKNSPVESSVLFIVILLLLMAPFQGLITSWPSSIFGHLVFWQTWKELLLIPAGLLTGLLIYRNRNLRQKFMHDKTTLLIMLYCVLSVVLAVTLSNDRRAAGASLLINLRFFLFYIVTWSLSALTKLDAHQIVRKYILPIALVVSVFAVLQLTVLTPEFLRHFGYAGNPIPARFTIDNDPTALRVASTTRGPNPLGAYLLVPLIFFVGLTYQAFKKHLKSGRPQLYQQLCCGLAILVLLIALYGTLSRSAFIGFIAALSCWLVLRFTKRNRTYLFGLLSVLVVLLGVVTYQLRGVSFIRNTVLHDNSGNLSSATSNKGHIVALEEGVRDVTSHPLTGCGPGCAGPASYHNSKGAKIAENYYIQIAQELGIGGLVLFLLIIYTVAKELYIHHSSSETARVMLATLVGLSIVCLLLHTWADDTVAYVWWGLAGLVIGAYSREDSVTATAKRPHTSHQ